MCWRPYIHKLDKLLKKKNEHRKKKRRVDKKIMKGLPNILWLEGEGMPFLLKDNNGLDSATNVDAMNKEINKV